MRTLPALLLLTLVGATAHAAEVPAVIQKESVDVYAQPKLDAPRLATLQRNASVRISAQQGLRYQLQLPTGAPGYVRVNDVRVAYADTADGDANLRVLMGGKAGKGRVTETAGVRGIDESDLKSAAFDQAQLGRMKGYQVDAAAAASFAQEQGWQATTVAYPAEAKGHKKSEKESSKSAVSKSAREGLDAIEQVFGSMLGKSAKVDTAATVDTAAKVVPKSEDELNAEELALGPEITGRILGARPLLDDAGAQQRVNRVGRWVASQTSRPELPWTFGVIDAPEVNAFAAPGGYILVTRGLYELVSSDSELAAVLGHEISHVVQRDHYNVIRKQEMATIGKDEAMSHVTVGGGEAGTYARDYAEQHGATIMLTSLDRDAEYRSDQAAQFYLARAGMNPLALYAVLQKMVALGSSSAGLAQLYKTHPPLDKRLDHIDQRGYGALEPYTTRE